jgi:hypothetical protein
MERWEDGASMLGPQKITLAADERGRTRTNADDGKLHDQPRRATEGHGEPRKRQLQRRPKPWSKRTSGGYEEPVLANPFMFFVPFMLFMFPALQKACRTREL